MYIYESHLGGLFVSEDILDFHQCYCEECGDSDTLIGEANSLEEAWALLKDQTCTFDEAICTTCTHKEDYDYCDNNCEEFSHSGGWSYNYICEFLYENFEVKDKTYCILISKHVNCDNMLLVNCKPNGHKFGECFSIPITPVLRNDSLSNRFKAQVLTDYLVSYKENSLKEITTKDIDGVKYILFKCESEEVGEEWKESAHYICDGWFGYMNINDVKDKFYNKKVLDFLLEHFSETE